MAVTFRRIHGHIVPIKNKGESNKKPKMVPAHVELRPQTKSVSTGSRFKSGAGFGALFSGIFGAGLVDVAKTGKGALAIGAGVLAGGALVGGGLNAIFGARKRTTWMASIVADKKKRKK